MLGGYLKSALRSVSRARTLTTVLVISLGLGAGANAAVYSVVNSLLFRAPGVVDPSRLVTIHTSQYDGSPFGPSSWPDYVSVAGSVSSLAAIAALDDRSQANVRVGDYTQLSRVSVVTENFFSTLGIMPHAGRLFQAGDAGSKLPSAVISSELWTAAGRPPLEPLIATIRGREHRVVGIAPEGFRGLQAGRVSDVWIPAQAPGGGRGDRRLALVGRLRPAATAEDVDRELQRLSEELATAFGATNRGMQGQPERARRITAIEYSRLPPGARSQARTIALIVGGAVTLLLVSACVNAGTLLLARGFARRRELAVKMALGATRSQLVTQLLLEALITSMGAAVLGLLVASWTATAIPALFSPDHAAMLDTHLRPQAILVTIGTACIVGVLFGLAPAFHATSAPASSALRGDAGGISEHEAGRRFHAALVTAQVALSTVLLLAAGLMAAALRDVLNSDRSYPARSVAMGSIEKPGRFEDPLRGTAFRDSLSAVLRRMPRVHTVAWGSAAPLTATTRNEFRIEAGAADVTDAIELDVNVVTVSYFHALGMNLIEGRLFEKGDQALTAPVAIVDERLVRRYFGHSAAGQHLLDAEGTRYKIVGVVRSRPFRTMQETPPATVYLPTTQRYIAQDNVFVVMRGDATEMAAALPRLMKQIDEGVRITRVTTLDRHIAEALAIDRLMTTLVGASGGFALLMAIIGVYGVMTDAVQRRTREIGLRVALGAARGQIARLVFAAAAYVSIAGLTIGTALAWVAGRLAGVFLGSIPDWEVTTLAAPPAMLGLIVAAAALLPLRRALSVSAATALRAE